MAAEEQQHGDNSHTMCQNKKLQSALTAFIQCHTQADTQNEALKVVGKILMNIKQNPTDEKFRRLRSTNDRLQRCLTGLENGKGVLEAIGFALQGEYWCLSVLETAGRQAEPSPRERQSAEEKIDHDEPSSSSDLQDYIEAQLRTFDRFFEDLEAGRYREERDNRIRLAREKEKACPDHFRKSVCRRHEQDEVRAQLLAKIEADKREREAEDRNGLLPHSFAENRGTNTRSSSSPSSSRGDDTKSSNKKKIYIHNGVLEPVAPPETAQDKRGDDNNKTGRLDNEVHVDNSQNTLRQSTAANSTGPFAMISPRYRNEIPRHRMSFTGGPTIVGAFEGVAPEIVADATSPCEPLMSMARRRVSSFATPIASSATLSKSPPTPTLRSNAYTQGEAVVRPRHFSSAGRSGSTTSIYTPNHQESKQCFSSSAVVSRTTARLPLGDYASLLDYDRSRQPTRLPTTPPPPPFTSSILAAAARLPSWSPLSSSSAAAVSSFGAGTTANPSPVQRRYSTHGYYRPTTTGTTFTAVSTPVVTPPPSARSTIGPRTPPAATAPPQPFATAAARYAASFRQQQPPPCRVVVPISSSIRPMTTTAISRSPAMYFQRNSVVTEQHAHINGCWTARDNQAKMNSSSAGGLPTLSEKSHFPLLQPQKWHEQQPSAGPSRTVSCYTHGSPRRPLLPMHGEDLLAAAQQKRQPPQYFVERLPSTRRTSFTALGY